jgi:hypothetical protein
MWRNRQQRQEQYLGPWKAEDDDGRREPTPKAGRGHGAEETAARDDREYSDESRRSALLCGNNNHGKGERRRAQVCSGREDLAGAEERLPPELCKSLSDPNVETAESCAGRPLALEFRLDREQLG